MRHIAREGRVWVIGVNPCVHVDQIPADFPDRDRVWRVLDDDEAEWVEPGNTVMQPNDEIQVTVDTRRRRDVTVVDETGA